MSVYYNEIDPFCCDWLRSLMKRGLIAEGEIDSRSIEDVRPDDLKGFTQCHFFAGIGGWPYALRLAGWPDDKPIFSGSCPCTPFSTAGKRKGFTDERHLWPAFFWLIGQCRPNAIIGEQVASSDALAWWDVVHTDLEAEGYACGVCDTCAAGYGAPHIRQRLYWAALSEQFRRGRRGNGGASGLHGEVQVEGRSPAGRLAHTPDEQNDQELRRPAEAENQWNADSVAGCSAFDRLGNAVNKRLERYPWDGGSGGGKGEAGSTAEAGESCGAMPTNGFWANPDWLWCRDKKWRPVKSGLSPLVDGISKRMGRGGDFLAIRQRLKGYGNAVVIPQAVEFIKAVMEVDNE